MVNINLTDWREERRTKKLQEFAVVVVVCLAISAIAVFGGITFQKDRIAYQNERNQFVERRLAELDEKIKEISTLKEERKALIARMNVIEKLQGDRPIIVHVFEDLATTLPEGVHYTQMKKEGTVISLLGEAESTGAVSDMMRNLEASDWFDASNLKKVGSMADNNQFEITVMQVNPADAEKEEAK